MKGFCINNVGVDAGMIMICDEKYYDKWGSKIQYNKNLHGVILSQRIMVEPGTYTVKWYIENTWNGDISGEGTVKTDSGIIAISDPCYCIKDWDRWLQDTNMGNDVSDDVVLIDKMGGDGCYEVNLELTKKEDSKIELEEVLKRLKEEGFKNIKTKEEVESEIKVFGKGYQCILAEDSSFRITYKDGKYVLETSYSNQPITKEWLNRANTLFVIGFIYKQV